MNATKTNSSSHDDDSLREEFREERRNRMIAGIAVLVLGAVATLGILYYFGAASAMGW
ncbi:MAG: hypothetical protein ABEN55_21975 [Bradymonadaceae bacterium]